MILTEIRFHYFSLLFMQSMRWLLNTKAKKGLLSPRQMVSARQVIHDLNQDAVGKMASVLNIHDKAMAPDELISVLTKKRTNGSLDDQIERKIKQIAYDTKLKALKDLTKLLKLTRESGELTIPQNTPPDLMAMLFSTQGDVSQVTGMF